MTEPMNQGAPGADLDVRARLTAGRQRFLDLELLCGPGALVPRPETEILGQTALRTLAAHVGPRVIDMCCGAGNLACAIAVRIPTAYVWASDLTDGSVQWTRRNVEHLGLSDRVTVCQGDLFESLDGLGLESTIDAVVCNPPYISSGRLSSDRAALLDHEPREAFDGGPYGLSIHQRVIAAAPTFLKLNGWLLMEFGLGQHRQIQTLLGRARRFTSIDFANDADGVPRVVVARFCP